MDLQERIQAVKDILDSNGTGKPMRLGYFRSLDKKRIVSIHYMEDVIACLLECAPDRMLEVSLAPRTLSYDLNIKLLRQYIGSKSALPSLADFNRDGVGFLLRRYGGSHVEAVMDAFPGKYRKWEFGRVPPGFWDNKHNAASARVWLEEKIGRTPRYKDYVENGITGAYRRKSDV